MNLDSALSAGQLAVGASLAAMYGARAITRGKARYARVEKNGSSALLGQGPMQMAYWALQPVARAAVRLGITANGVTYASLAIGIAAGVALGAGHLGIAAALSTVSALGDALDGLVARASGTASNAGETLDAAVDRYNELAFVGGFAVYFRQSLPMLTLALLALGASFMVSYSTAKAEALGVDPPRGAMRRTERAVYLNFGAGLVPLVALVSEEYANAPAVLALGLVAVVGNVSAVRRLGAIARSVALRDQLAAAAGNAATTNVVMATPSQPANDVLDADEDEEDEASDSGDRQVSDAAPSLDDGNFALASSRRS